MPKDLNESLHASPDTPNSGYLGAAVHGALALMGAVEFFVSQTKARKFLAGAVVGWHIQSTVWHLRERARNRRKEI